MQTDEEVQRND